MKHERIHAAKAVDQVLAPLLVAVHQDLGVGVAVEDVAGSLELGAKLLEVVDLAVHQKIKKNIIARQGLTPLL